jgi:hypothetical protein
MLRALQGFMRADMVMLPAKSVQPGLRILSRHLAFLQCPLQLAS